MNKVTMASTMVTASVDFEAGSAGVVEPVSKTDEVD